jgi:hypothetical protein
MTTGVLAPFAWLLHRLKIPVGPAPAWHAMAGFMLRFYG